MRTVGILGGMGPEATAELYLRIIRIFQERWGAKYDADFPKIFICNLPLPDVVETVNTGSAVQEMLVKAVQELELVGADFVAVPCNTVSYFLEGLRTAVSVPILSIPEEAAKVVRQRRFQKVGILGTEMTLRTNLYGRVLPEVELVVPSTEQIALLTEIIMNILSGKKREEDRRALAVMIELLRSRGAQVVILGCTELPLLVSGKEDVIDTIGLLAEVVVKRAIDI